MRVWSDRAIRAALAYSHSAEAVPSTAAMVLSTDAAALSKFFWAVAIPSAFSSTLS